jgi:hypothetical protein
MRPLCFVLCCLLARELQAQAAPDARRPFEIADNSFLVEEAFNQEAGVFQNILVFRPPRAGAWELEFTQEWPLGGQRHQFSFTVPLAGVRASAAEDYHVTRGPLALTYRYQLTVEEGAGFASSPRLSVLIPREDVADQWGVQINLPFSRQFSNFYVHANAGSTIEQLGSAATTRWHAAGSVIYRVLPMVHAMLESVYRTDELESDAGWEDDWVLSPGFRAGINLGDHQLVLGAALPIGLREANDTRHFITYISYELPFMRR